MARKKLTPRTAQNLTTIIDSFILSREAEGCRKKTLTFYREQMTYFLRFAAEQAEAQGVSCDLDFLTSRLITSYLVDRRNKGCKANTVHAAWRTIRTLCNWIEKDGEYPQWVNASSRVTPPRQSRELTPPMTQEILDALVKSCDDKEYYGCHIITEPMLSRRDKALILVLATGGMRSSECMNLTWGDINLHTGQVSIKDGKGGKSRTTIIAPSARVALKKYQAHLTDTNPETFVWVGVKGQKLGYHGLYQMVAKRCEYLDKKLVGGVHGLRRYWTSATAAKMGLMFAQKLGGWSDMASIKHYLQPTDDQLLDAYETMVLGKK